MLPAPGDVAGGGFRVGELQAHRQREAGAVWPVVVCAFDGGAGAGPDLGERVRGREQVYRAVGSQLLDGDGHEVLTEPSVRFPAQTGTAGGHDDRDAVVVAGRDGVGGQLATFPAIEPVAATAGARPGVGQHRVRGAFHRVEADQQHSGEVLIQAVEQRSAGEDELRPRIE